MTEQRLVFYVTKEIVPEGGIQAPGEMPSFTAVEEATQRSLELLKNTLPPLTPEARLSVQSRIFLEQSRLALRSVSHPTSPEEIRQRTQVVRGVITDIASEQDRAAIIAILSDEKEPGGALLGADDALDL